jgi:protein kinase-like protein
MSTWRLDGFTEVGELGSGAQGRVVLARRGESGPYVAIKYLPAGEPATRVPSRHEARLLGAVDDPHVARLYELVEGPDGAAMVMEAVEGVSLSKLLGRHGMLEPEAALVVLKGSLLGLAAAHAAGIVHRDYKPANVIVQADGVSKLIDFGVATRSGERSLAGTPVYMAPEQWGGAPATAATDVYAATCVFFECVTGATPYRGDSQMVLMAQHATAPVPVDRVPPPLRELVAHGMAKNPDQRPATAGEFAEELEAAAVAAYGEDWERRGLLALGSAAAALAALFPQAVVAGQGGTSMATTSLGQGALGGGAASAGAAGVVGRLSRRLGRPRLAAAIGIAIVAAVVVATVAIVLGGTKAPMGLTKRTPPGTTSPAPSGSSPSPSLTPSPSPSVPPSASPSVSPAPSGTGTVPIVVPPNPSPRVPTPGPTDPGGGPTTSPPPPTCPAYTIPAYDFGDVAVGRTLTREFAFPWLECDDEQNITIQGPGRGGYAPPALASCPPAAEQQPCSFRVTFRPTVAGRTYQATVVIPDDDGDPAVTLQLTGRGQVIENCPTQNPPAQSLGEVRAGESVERAIPLVWNSCYDATGIRVEGSEAFSRSSDCPPDGGTQCTVTVTFAPPTAGSYSATLLVPNDAGEIAVRIPLTGTGTAPPCPQQDPPAQSFGEVRAGESVERAIPVTWNSCYDAAGIRVQGSEAFSQTSDCPPGDGTQCTVTVTFAPPTPGGYSATLLVPNDSGEIAVRIPLTGTGTAPPCPQQDPPAQSFGEVAAGESAERAIPLTWNDCYDAAGIRVQGSEAFSQSSDCPPDGGTQCTVNVTFAPPTAGSYSATLLVPNDAGEIAVRIPLTGTGTPPPCPHRNLPEVSFGEVTYGEFRMENVRVAWNECYDAESIRVEGNDAFTVDESSCPPAESSSCSILVTFAPRSKSEAPKQYRGVLLIRAQDGGERVRIPLSGTGVPAPECPEQHLKRRSFGPTAVGAEEYQSISLRWYGCYNIESLQINDDSAFSIKGTTCSAEVVGRACEVVVRFRPRSYPAETSTFTATLTVLDDTGAALVTVPLSGEVEEQEEPEGGKPGRPGSTDDPTPEPSEPPATPEPTTPPEDDPEPSTPPEDDPEPRSPPDEDPAPTSPPKKKPSAPEQPSAPRKEEPSSPPKPTLDAPPQPKTPPTAP